MKLTRGQAQAIKCLGGKLEIATNDPDPKALEELTLEYNCKNCHDVDLCRKVYRAVN
ncbi:hypothetical protein LCGC14_2807850 [marine sediment metagenome]|uniref:Uncharacterized protein n=1 Tax=marine sediment metagenome TaxID=412755 RepID=A0A0F8YKU3_9ZZZZ